MEPLLTELKTIYESKGSDFYKKHWGSLPVSFSDIPVLRPDDLVNTPLYERLYKEEQGLVKFVDRNGKGFLVRRSLNEIKNDERALPGAVPLVVFKDPNEGIEHSLWCYEKGALPYIGDLGNLPVTLICAEQFKTDTLLCDMSSLKEILSANELPETVKSISVIDSSFVDRSLLKEVQKDYDTKMFLSLPEAGIIASLALEENGKLQMRPEYGVVLECRTGKLTLTKTALSTPLVHYETDLNCEEVDEVLCLL